MPGSMVSTSILCRHVELSNPLADITYVRPKVPTLYSALTTGEYANNATVYGRDTNSFVLNKNDVIEIILNNDDPGKHPFHLHGHNFQVIYRSPDEWGFYDPAVSTFHHRHQSLRVLTMNRTIPTSLKAYASRHILGQAKWQLCDQIPGR